MEKKESAIKLPESYQKLTTGEVKVFGRKNTVKVTWCLLFLCFALLVAYSVVSVWCLKSQVNILQKKIILMEMRTDVQILKSLQELTHLQMETKRESEEEGQDEDTILPSEEDFNLFENELDSITEENSMGDYSYGDRDDSLGDSDDTEDETEFPGFKRKREIRNYNHSSIEKDFDKSMKNETEEKPKSEKSSAEKASAEKASAEKASTELSSLEKSSSEVSSSKEKFQTSYRHIYPSTRKPHYHRKYRKSRIGSAERFFTETHSTTSTPIEVRQSRTKATHHHGIDRALWIQNQKFQQHKSPLRDTITKEEALKRGYGKHLDEVDYSLETSNERVPDALSYNMIMIHFSADTSHYSRDRDPHYFGNGRMQIKSDVYKDWKPAHWTQGVGMSKYFHLHQGRVTISTTGIYLIYAQIQYSNVQEVNGFSVFRNKEVVVQCITTSTHPDKHEIKSNTCAISTTILLQSNDSICIKDLHHGRYVVLTPEKSYFGLVLLSPFKN